MSEKKRNQNVVQHMIQFSNQNIYSFYNIMISRPISQLTFSLGLNGNGSVIRIYLFIWASLVYLKPNNRTNYSYERRL